MYKLLGKRLIDFTVAFLLMVFLLPLFLLIAVLLFMMDRGNPFFIQARPGKDERIFKLIKFRTMVTKTDSDGHLLPDSERLTGFGKLIRSMSLDELPQLINVLNGDMSLIGPRPLLVEYLPLYNSFQRKRHIVKPGITGWAQVNGRNLLTWDEKFILDVWYVENISFKLDLQIFFKTFLKIFLREGVASTTSATMEKFKGNI